MSPVVAPSLPLDGFAPVGYGPAMAVLLALAGLGSAILVGLALAAFARRRSRPYLLIVLALATLLVRTAVAALTMTAALSLATHHTLEHVLDVAMAALVIAAVYTARAARRTGDPEREQEGTGVVDE